MGLLYSQRKKYEDMSKKQTTPRLVETATGGVVLDAGGKEIDSYTGYLGSQRKQQFEQTGQLPNYIPPSIAQQPRNMAALPSVVPQQQQQKSVEQVAQEALDKKREEMSFWDFLKEAGSDFAVDLIHGADQEAQKSKSVVSVYDPNLGKTRYFGLKGDELGAGVPWDKMNVTQKIDLASKETLGSIGTAFEDLSLGTIQMATETAGFISSIAEQTVGKPGYYLSEKLGFGQDKMLSQHLLDFATTLGEFRQQNFKPKTVDPEDFNLMAVIKNPALILNPEILMLSGIGALRTVAAFKAGDGLKLAKGEGGRLALTAIEGSSLLNKRRRERIENGETENMADLAYALGVGYINAWFEELTLKMQLGGKPLPIKEALLRKIKNHLAKSISSFAINVGSEMFEEGFQAAFPMFVESAMFQERYSIKNTIEQLKKISPVAFEEASRSAAMAIPAAVGLGAFGTIQENKYRSTQEFLDSLTPEQRSAIENIQESKQQYEAALKANEIENNKLSGAGEKIANNIFDTFQEADALMIQNYKEAGQEMIKNGKLNQKVIDGRVSDITNKLKIELGNDGKVIGEFIKAGLKGREFKTYQDFVETTKELIEQALPPQEAKVFDEKFAESKKIMRGEGGAAQAISRQSGAEAKFGEGFYFSKDIEVAQDLAGEEGKVTTKFLKPNVNLYQIKDEKAYRQLATKLIQEAVANGMPFDNTGELIKQYVLKEGYDGTIQNVDKTALHDQDTHAGLVVYNENAFTENAPLSKQVQERVETQQKEGEALKKRGETIKKTEKLGQEVKSQEKQAKTTQESIELSGIVRTKIIPEKDLKYVYAEAKKEGIDGTLGKAISKPLSQKEIEKLTDKQKTIINTALSGIAAAEGMSEGAIIQNIEALGGTPPITQRQTNVGGGEAQVQPTGGTQKTSIQTPPIKEVSIKNVQTAIDKLSKLDEDAKNAESARKSEVATTRENMRIKIAEALKKDAQTFVDVKTGKGKASAFTISVKKLPNGKYGYAITMNTPTLSRAVSYNPKFATKEKAMRMGVQRAVRMIEEARQAGTNIRGLAKMKSAIMAANRSLGKEALPAKRVKKAVAETKRKIKEDKYGTDVEVVKGVKTYYKKENGKIVIRDEDNNLILAKEDTLAKAIKKAKRNIENLSIKELKENSKRLAAVPAGGVASVGSIAIGEFERVAQKDEEIVGEKADFKLADKTLMLIRKYAKRIGEGYLPLGVKGIFKKKIQTIRIKGLTSLSTAVHEIAHFLDMSKVKLSEKIINELKRNNKLRVQLKDLYLEFYPGAKETHRLEKKIVEGFATFIQKYAENPSEIESKYPDLVQAILYEGGELYNPLFNEIIADVRDMVSEYQQLPALQKLASRLTYEEKREIETDVITKEGKAREVLVDEIYPIEALAKEQEGKHFTVEDISLWLRASQRTARAVIANNIEGLDIGEKGYHRLIDGEVKKTLDFTWDDLIKKVYRPYDISYTKAAWKQLTKGEKTDIKENLRKNEENGRDWDSFLIARLKHFEYQRLDTLKEIVDNHPKQDEMTFMPKEEIQEIIDEKKEYFDLASVIKNDEITREEAAMGYEAGKVRFSEEARMFDSLKNEDILFASDPMVQLISPEDAKKFIAREGYAPVKRAFYDELLGDSDNIPRSLLIGKNKLSSFFRRKGSSREIISPTISAIRNHTEITRKGFKQITYNLAVDYAQTMPDVFEILPLEVVENNDGSLKFPQENDPNIIMARNGYKKTPILVNKEIKTIFDDVLNYKNIDEVFRFTNFTSRIFTKGTTGAFLQFGAIVNPLLDQFTLAAQSRFGAVPFFSTGKMLVKILKNKNGEEARLLREYLMWGGQQYTLSHSADETAAEYIKRLEVETNQLKALYNAIEKGTGKIMDVITYLSTKSEVLTRSYEYIKSRQSGEAPVVAFERAGRVTASFHHIGSMGGRGRQNWLRSVAFANAGLQVVHQAYNSLTENPQTRKRFGFVVGSIMAAQAASLGALLAFGSDEDKRKYLGLNPEELSKYLFIPKPGGGFLKIRLSETLSVPGTLLNMVIAEAFLKAEYSTRDYYTAATSFVPKQFNLPRLFFKGGLAEWGASIIPQFPKTIGLTALNLRDYPTIIPLVSQKLARLEKGEQYTESTSLLMIKLGKQFNFSPIKADALMTGVFGRATGYLTAKPSAYNFASPLIFREYFYSTRQIQKYYDIKEEIDPQYNTYNKLKKENTAESMKTLAKNKERYNEVIATKNKLKLVEKALNEYNDINEETQPLVAEAKRKEIFRLINNL